MGSKRLTYSNYSVGSSGSATDGQTDKPVRGYSPSMTNEETPPCLRDPATELALGEK